LASGKRQQDILDMYPNLNISKKTITNINKKIDLNTELNEFLEMDNSKINVTSKYFYTGVDDSYSNLLDKKEKVKNMFRVAYFHDGYDENKSTAKRKVLKDKKSFIKITNKTKNSDTSITEYKKEFMGFLNKNYDLKNSILTLSGDGAG
jgi:hypothetical protein